MPDGPLIVQSDNTVLLDVDHPLASEVRQAIAPFTELERAPEHIHTYRITPLALWNARAAGQEAAQVVEILVRYSRYPVPQPLLNTIAETMGRYGRVRLISDPTHGLVLVSSDPAVLTEILCHKKIRPLLGQQISADTVCVPPAERGRIKAELIKIGWPAEDLAGYVEGKSYPLARSQEHVAWEARDYQRWAADAAWAGGSGVVVLPCGAGKTVVGIETMVRAQKTTLILVNSTVAGRQWKRELLQRTTLREDEIGEYSGERKEIRPITIATYQVVTRKTQGVYRSMELFDSQDWGLIIYDEVHLLPAPVFRLTADLQSRRRLGLTATLVREDGREGDVFSLIGPKRFDMPWKDVEAQGWIASAECTEVRVTLTEEERMSYATASQEDMYRRCAAALSKDKAVARVHALHPHEPTLIIGVYLDQLERIAASLDAPLVQGATRTSERERLFDAFRRGEITTLVVSKVANFSIDLPEASVAIQVSGTYRSRQEEAQRLGRLLRPKQGGRAASFYTIVARDTIDTTYAAYRQRFLAEQGYGYRIVNAADLTEPNTSDYQ